MSTRTLRPTCGSATVDVNPIGTPTARETLSDAGSRGPVVGSVCTGYGGLDLGVVAALDGGRIAWVADPDPHVRQILDARLPGVLNLGDIRTIDWTRVEPVEVLTAGFPCQDISAAGRRLGIEKGRRSGLWTDIVAGVRVLRPALLVVENVAALRWRNGGLHRVLGDLAEAGYDAAWRSVRAADIGAPHRRERVFLLAWPRPPRTNRRDRRRGGDAADTDRARRLVQRHQRHHQTGWTVSTGHAPGTTAPDTDGFGREELHTPHPDRWTVTTRPSPALADTNRGRLPLRRDPDSARPGTADPDRVPDTHRLGAPAAHTPCHGRDERLPGTAGFQGRPDAALGGDPPADTVDEPAGRPQRGRRHLVALPAPTSEPPRSSEGQSPAASPNWGGYEAAIRRWEMVLDRPAPHPTQRGNHGRPVLAPAFVEWLMGLPAGWVTDLPLPRTAQLRALGNGVVPRQATHAVCLLLDDLAALLHTDHQPETGPEVAA